LRIRILGIFQVITDTDPDPAFQICSIPDPFGSGSSYESFSDPGVIKKIIISFEKVLFYSVKKKLHNFNPETLKKSENVKYYT